MQSKADVLTASQSKAMNSISTSSEYAKTLLARELNWALRTHQPIPFSLAASIGSPQFPTMIARDWARSPLLKGKSPTVGAQTMSTIAL